MSAHFKNKMTTFLSRLISLFAWFYIHCVAFTSVVRWKNQSFRREIENSFSSFIFAFWHGRQIFLTWAHKNYPCSVLVSKSKDGEYIAKTLHLFGIGTTRGSSSRGGMRALIELKKTLESGLCTAFTPDGPKGPQRTVHSGVLYLAQKTGKPILPVTYSAKRKLIFKGWDDYWVPLPFNSILLSYGKPVQVNPGDNLHEKAAELSEALNRITDQADQEIRTR